MNSKIFSFGMGLLRRFVDEMLMGKSKMLAAFLFLLVLPTFYNTACAQGASPDGYEQGVIYVKVWAEDPVSIQFDSQTHVVTPAVLAPIFAQFQVYGVDRPFLDLGSSFNKCYSIYHHSGQSKDLVAALAIFPFVQFAERVPHDEPDMDCPNMPNNPVMNYYMERVRACEAFDLHNWNNAPGAPHTIVAVVDDAVMTNHEDLVVFSGHDVAHNRPDPNVPFAIAGQNGTLDFFEHGTFVASIANGTANNTLGVSSMGWFNDLMAVKCQHDQAGGPAGAPPIMYYRGVAWAASHGARVINMSWGANVPAQMNYDIIVAARATGAILVGTAGNRDNLPNLSTPRYPGWYGEGTTGMPWENLDPFLVVSTASLDESDNRGVTSRLGPAIDVSAYGVGIQVAEIPRNGTSVPNNSYTSQTGTSMAAPQVSALSGLLWSYNPAATSSEVIGCILGTANPDIYGPAHPGNIPGTLGSGRIDAYEALRCLSTTCDPVPSVAIIPSHRHVCPNGTTLTVNRGASYLWSTGATTRTISINAAGTYSVTVTFPQGCTSTTQVTLPAAPVQANVEASTFCNGYELLVNGAGSSFLWSINGGAPFNHQNRWRIFQTGNVSYAVTVSDLGGCLGLNSEVSGTVTIPPLPQASITAQENDGVPNDGIICAAGPVTLTASGGVSYAWNSSLSTDILGTTASITVLPTATTTYYVTATDAEGCNSIGNYTITVDPNHIGMALYESSGVPNDGWLCEVGAPVSLSVGSCPGNAYTYHWSTGATTSATVVFPAVNTTYTVTVTGNNGNTRTLSKTVFVVDGSQIMMQTLETSGSPNDGVICEGASAILRPTEAVQGFHRYLWDNGETTRSIVVSQSGTYAVTVTVNACTYVRTATITVIPAPNATITVNESSGEPDDGIVCQGSNVVLTASSPTTDVTYQWSGGLGVAPVVNAVPVAPFSTYTVTVTSSNGCTSTAEVRIHVGAEITVSESSGVPNDRTLCAPGAPATLTADAGVGAAYVWSTGATTAQIAVNPVQTTTYSVTTTNSDGCTGTQSATVTVHAPGLVISVTENSGTPNDGIVCSGSPVTLSVAASPGATYRWSTAATTASIAVSPIQTGSFSVTVSYPNGCTYTLSRLITVRTSPFVAIVAEENSGIPNDGVLCMPGSVVLSANATQGVTYLWSTGATTQQITVAPTVTTTYSVTVSSNNGCAHSNTINIVIGALITTTEGNPPGPGDGNICLGDRIILTAQGSTGATYLWSTGENGASITVMPGVTTTYTVTATDQIGGCTNEVSTVVTVVQPNTNFSLLLTENSGVPNDGTICAGSPFTLAVTPAQNGLGYLWSTGETTSQISHAPTNASAPNYRVTITVGNACTHVLSRELIVLQSPDIMINISEISGTHANDGIICPLAEATLTATEIVGVTYQWSHGLGTNRTVTVNPAQTTTYGLTVTSGNSCSRAFSQTIFVLPAPDAAFSHSVSPCRNVVFEAAQNQTGSAHFWEFGDNTTSTEVNPAHTYARDDSYLVRHTVTTACGSTMTIQTIQVTAPLPDAAFSVSLDCRTAAFTAASNPLGSTHLWNFGDNTTSNLVNPSHTYAVNGTYEVTHMITDACGHQDSKQAIAIDAPSPDASFTHSIDCRTVRFVSAQNHPNAMHLWLFGDGGTSTLPNPAHTYAIDGTYNVTHTVTDICGTETTTQTVVVSAPLPDASFTYTVINCRTVDFAAQQNPPGSTHFWEFGDGKTGVGPNLTYTYVADGTYIVTHTLTDACASQTATETVVIVVQALDPGFAFVVDCQTVSFTPVQNPPASVHTWVFGDGTSSNDPSPAHTYGGNGTYTVEHYIADACGSYMASQSVTIATATLSIQVEENSGTPNDGVLCTNSGASAIITATSNVGNYSWSNGATTASITVAPTVTTTYTVTVSGLGLCPATASVTVRVQACDPGELGCPCPLGVMAYSYPHSTSVSATKLPAVVNNACIYIGQKLVVDKRLTISNSTIIMGAGAEIEIDIVNDAAGYLRLDNNKEIKGCSTMWKGITVKKGRLILVNNKMIRDAHHAVELQGRSNLSINGNTFDKNYIAIYIPPLAFGQTRSPQPAFLNNKFKCTGNLAPKYPGQPSAPDWAVAGALIHDQPGIAFSGGGTEFDGPSNGIVAFKSTFTVKDAKFVNLKDGQIDLSYPFSYVYATGVFADGSQAMVLKTKMTGVRMGIMAQKSSVTAEGNEITAVPASKGGLIAAIRITAANLGLVSVRDNFPITTAGFGIDIDGCNMPGVVHNNRVGILPVSGSAGIRVKNSQSMRVSNNEVVREGDPQTSSEGFSFSNVWACDVLDNISAGVHTAFRNQYNNHAYFLHNRAMPHNLTTPPRVGKRPEEGFWFLASTPNYYCDNTADAVMTGFAFGGNCNATDAFRCNTFRNSGWGLFMTTDAETGTQGGEAVGDLNNKWETSLGLGAIHFSSDDKFILRSQFTMNPPLPDWETQVPPPTVVQWFRTAPLFKIDCGNCGGTRYPDPPTEGENPPGTDGPASVQMSVTPAQIEAAEDILSASNWDAQERLYELLMHEPSLTSGSNVLGQFAAQSGQNQLGQLWRLRQKAFFDEAEWAVPKARLAHLQHRLAQKWAEVAELQSNGTETPALWAKQTEALGLAQEAGELEAQMKVAREAARTEVLGLYTAITPLSTQAATEKAVYSLLWQHRLWENTQPDSTVLSELKSLADLCPSTHGLSVYVARSWYMVYRPDADWDIQSGCFSPRPVEAAQPLRPTMSAIRVVPNPAQDHLHLWVESPDEQEGHFELRDLSGRLWKEIVIGAGEQTATVDVSAFPNGLYLYIFRQKGKMPKVGKISIIH